MDNNINNKNILDIINEIKQLIDGRINDKNNDEIILKHASIDSKLTLFKDLNTIHIDHIHINFMNNGDILTIELEHDEKSPISQTPNTVIYKNDDLINNTENLNEKIKLFLNQ